MALKKQDEAQQKIIAETIAKQQRHYQLQDQQQQQHLQQQYESQEQLQLRQQQEKQLLLSQQAYQLQLHSQITAQQQQQQLSQQQYQFRQQQQRQQQLQQLFPDMYPMPNPAFPQTQSPTVSSARFSALEYHLHVLSSDPQASAFLLSDPLRHTLDFRCNNPCQATHCLQRMLDDSCVKRNSQRSCYYLNVLHVPFFSLIIFRSNLCI